MQVAQVGFEPTASLVLSQGGLPVAYRAMCLLCPKQESNLQSLGFKPSRSASWRIRALLIRVLVVPDGLEPPLAWVQARSRCRWTTGPVFERKPWDSNPQRSDRTCSRDRLPGTDWQDASWSRPDDFHKVPGVGIEPTPSTTTASRRCPEPGVTTSSNCPGISLHKRHAPLVAVRGQIGEQDLNLHRRVQGPAACR